MAMHPMPTTTDAASEIAFRRDMIDPPYSDPLISGAAI
jgi:hypothetical protein